MRSGPLLSLVLALALSLPGSAGAQIVSRNVNLESHHDDYVTMNGSGYKYSSCWSYVHQDGREYVAIGTAAGTAIYNVTDPVNSYSVGFIPGPNSVWRNIKTYRNWIYIVSEGIGAGEGMQIVSMVDPENPTLMTTYTSTFVLAHTVEIDTTRALLFANGTRSKTGPGTYPNAGVRILSLALPEAPIEVASWPASGFNGANYVHDSYPTGNRLYAGSINVGIVRVIDTTNPASPFEITNWTYPGAFSHNVWANDAESHLYVTDETVGEPVKVFDISNINAPVLVNTFTPDPSVVLHNVHVRGGELFLAGYTTGLRVLDISDPAHPAEFASFDPDPDPTGGYGGIWEVAAYFPSGTVAVSDMNTGLYVLTPDRSNYAVLRVECIEDVGEAPVEGASVFISGLGDSALTTAAGVAAFGPQPGTYTVSAQAFGYEDDDAIVMVTGGNPDTVELRLVLKPTAPYTGTVIDEVSTDPLPTSEVVLAYTPLSATADVNGEFSFPSVPQDLYLVQVSSPGHAPRVFDLLVDPLAPPVQEIAMYPAEIYDDYELPSGWSVGAPGDAATTGIWERVEPLGTGEPQPGPMTARKPLSARLVEMTEDPTLAADALREAISAAAMAPGDVQPEFDRTPDPGDMCYVTGQGTSPGSIGEEDVDNGKTSLVSPVYDVTGMGDPYVGCWKWLYKTGGIDDWLAVFVSDDGGATYTPVDTFFTSEPAWKEFTFRVADYVAITNQLRVKFVAADLGGGTIVEAAIDDVIVWDESEALVDVAPVHPRVPQLAFAPPRPNPARGNVSLALELPVAGSARVEVYDVSGRLVRTLFRGSAPAGTLSLTWDGLDESGHSSPAGLYFARASTPVAAAQVRFVRVR